MDDEVVAEAVAEVIAEVVGDASAIGLVVGDEVAVAEVSLNSGTSLPPPEPLDIALNESPEAVCWSASQRVWNTETAVRVSTPRETAGQKHHELRLRLRLTPVVLRDGGSNKWKTGAGIVLDACVEFARLVMAFKVSVSHIKISYKLT